MATFADSHPHGSITAKLFRFSTNIENRMVVFGSAPALTEGAPGSWRGRYLATGGREFKSGLAK
jgi:hypothetical protein